MANSGVAINDAGLGLARIVDANEFIVISTTLATAITVTGSQSANVVSSTGMIVDQLIAIDSGVNYEIVQVTAIADGTHFTASFTKTHVISVLVGQTVERQIAILGDPNTYANQAAVKAGSVMPVASDMALVVTNSPNSANPCASTGTPTNITGVTTNTVLLASNAARKGTYIVNDGTTQILYIAYGFTASLTAYSIALQPGAIQTPDVVCFTGPINGIWSAVGATARITELTN